MPDIETKYVINIRYFSDIIFSANLLNLNLGPCLCRDLELLKRARAGLILALDLPGSVLLSCPLQASLGWDTCPALVWVLTPGPRGVGFCQFTWVNQELKCLRTSSQSCSPSLIPEREEPSEVVARQCPPTPSTTPHDLATIFFFILT